MPKEENKGDKVPQSETSSRDIPCSRLPIYHPSTWSTFPSSHH